MKKLFSLLTASLLILSGIHFEVGQFVNIQETSAEGVGVTDTLVLANNCPTSGSYTVNIKQDNSGNGGHRLISGATKVTAPVGSTFSNIVGGNNAYSVDNELFITDTNILNTGADQILTVNFDLTLPASGNVTSTAFVETGNGLFSDTATELVSITCGTPPNIVIGDQETPHDNSQPTQAYTKTDTCTGDGITAFTVSGADVANAQPAVIGANSATIEYDVVSANGEPYTTADIDLECTNPIGTDTDAYQFEFTNIAPTFSQTVSEIPHSNGVLAGSFTVQAEPNETDVCDITDNGGDAELVPGAEVDNADPCSITYNYNFAANTIGTFTRNIEATDKHPVTGATYDTSTYTVEFEITDNPGAVSLSNFDTSNFGGVGVDNISQSDLPSVVENLIFDLSVSDADVADANRDFLITGINLPSGWTLVNPVLPLSVSPNDGAQQITISGNSDSQIGGNIVVVGSDSYNNAVNATQQLGQNSGDQRDRNDGVGTDIVQGYLHGDDVLFGGEDTLITGGFGNDTITFDDDSTTGLTFYGSAEEERACWLVARDAAGKVIETPEKVPKPASEEVKEDAEETFKDLRDFIIRGEPNIIIEGKPSLSGNKPLDPPRGDYPDGVEEIDVTGSFIDQTGLQEGNAYDPAEIDEYINGIGTDLSGYLEEKISISDKIVFEDEIFDIGTDIYGSGYDSLGALGFGLKGSVDGNTWNPGGYVDPVDGTGLHGSAGDTIKPPSGMGVKTPPYDPSLGNGEGGAVGDYWEQTVEGFKF